MLKDLREVLDEVSKEKQCKLLVFQGAGKHFSFGVSVEEHTVELAPKMLADFNGLILTLSDLAIPVCSLISGQCLGGGLEVAAFAHFMFADESARMGQPEINLSVFAPPASVMLPLKIGHGYADDILLTGRSINAHEARRMGLVYEVYADKETMEEKVNEWIERHIIPKSAIALKIATRIARKRFSDRLREDLKAFESVYLNELMKTYDAQEGLNSFMEGRKPVWKDE
jgi:cyclohexa-1,5-dienecarbonyl-CoA hydratase